MATNTAPKPEQTENTNQAEAPKKTRKPREKDTSLAGQLLDQAKEVRKSFRAMGAAAPGAIDEVRKEAADLRKRVAELVNDPEAMNQAIKDMRKAENKVDRLINKTGDKRSEVVEKLQALRAKVDAAIEALDD